ncbi:thioesterase family protein [Parageobacillus sp. KH3-4]|jgi:YbgC/YbaW family acyl-CoA thioester hydrolase|uniref:acyl-CoA thioesterase n=1 Tax=Parageobacillus sp. KH3-4 TaxID=2916802 RepID=UPI001FCBE531|nr:thioesterase family protein [Parageobacillus sp. KH3-4]BDG46924.1 4-hydroxybenzoyl-CoA thioesterase [Parageobacillus sp. KH3-4]
MKKIEYRFQVQWGDTDAAGIVFYPNFYKWMDEATHRFFAELGNPTTALFEQKIGLPILEAKCQFRSPLLFGDEVRVCSTITELWDKVFQIAHEFYKHETVAAAGYETRAWASFADGRPKAVPIPAEVKRVLAERQSSRSAAFQTEQKLNGQR